MKFTENELKVGKCPVCSTENSAILQYKGTQQILICIVCHTWEWLEDAVNSSWLIEY